MYVRRHLCLPKQCMFTKTMKIYLLMEMSPFLCNHFPLFDNNNMVALKYLYWSPVHQFKSLTINNKQGLVVQKMDNTIHRRDKSLSGG